MALNFGNYLWKKQLDRWITSKLSTTRGDIKMNGWKQALQLVRYEMNYSKRYFFLHLAFIIFALYLVTPIMTESFENGFFMLDLLFFLVIVTLSQLMIPKPFKVQHLDGYTWASHFIILLNQLAISKKTIVKYRFLSYLVITLTFSGLFLLLLYFFSSFLQQHISVQTYIVFSIFWLCFSVFVGGLQIVLDTGYNFVLSMIATFLLIGPIVMLAILYLFYVLYPNGFVHWTLMIATEWPFQTSVISITLAFLGGNYWMKWMEKRMNRIDYFS